jgi:hypothetical protein
MRSATGEPDPAVEIGKLEERLDKFRISADSDITYRGSAWQGYAFNIPACEETTIAPNPGACCLPDGSCEVVTPGQCLLDGGTFVGGSCTPNPCSSPTPCGPPCTNFPFTASISIICDGGGGTCTCSGSMAFFSPANCDYRGGCNAGDCSSMPITVNIKNVGGIWQIFISFDTTFTGLCTNNDSFCTGWDGATCVYVDLTSDPSPVGTYSIALGDEGFPGSATVNIVILPCTP